MSAATVSSVASTARTATLRSSIIGVDAVIFLAALAARVGIIYGDGGSIYDGAGYDASVYYGAADALVHGLIPYRDFTLLHPPLLMLLLSPVAALGRLTSDRAGFEVATGLSLLVGSVNAVLVTRIARRMNLGNSAAAVGGLIYAVTLLTAQSEYSSRLEVFGNFFVLLGVWCYVASARTDRLRLPFLGGAALATATSVKIWYAAPLVLVLLWHCADRRPRRHIYGFVAGAITAGTLIDGPFFILAPLPMLRMVLLDQFGRPRGGSILTRMSDLDLLNQLKPHAAITVQLACAMVAAVVVAFGAASAWRIRSARLAVALLATSLIVLFAAPVYFASYADYAMPAACLCAAAAATARRGAATIVRRRIGPGLGWLVVAAATLTTVVGQLVDPVKVSQPSPDRYLQRAAAAYRCVQSDSPQPLIALNVLSSDLAHGCPQWVDASGRTYGIDRAAGNLPRTDNGRWQRDLLHYLRAGQAFVLVDIRREGLSSRTLAILYTGRPIARGDGIVLRPTVPSRRPSRNRL